jgi:hypothetical protein
VNYDKITLKILKSIDLIKLLRDKLLNARRGDHAETVSNAHAFRAVFFFFTAALFFVCAAAVLLFRQTAFAAPGDFPKKRGAQPAAVVQPLPAQPVDAAFLSRSAEEHAKKISRSVEALQKYYSSRDTAFYSQIGHIGSPRAIEIDGRTAAYEIPLISGDYTARFIYIDPAGRLLFPPAGDSSGARFFLTGREWKEIARSNYLLPADNFVAYPPDYSWPHFPFQLSERQQGLSELSGFPVVYEALSDFKMIDYIGEMPSKSISKRKVTVLSRSGNETIELMPLKSFSYAAAYCADWWHIAASCSSEIVFERYSDFISGKPAFGINPRAVEMTYLKRAETETEFFKFSDYIKDALFTGEKFHSSLEGYASALVLPDVSSAPEISDKSTVYPIDKDNKFYMGDEYIELFRGQGPNAETLAAALDIHGIVLAGIPFFLKGIPLSHSVKAIAITGYKKTEGSILFAYKDFEDPVKIFRVAPAELFSEAYCFAHEFRAKARYIVKKRKLTLETFNHKGIKIDVDSILATFPVDARRVKFLKEEQGFYFHQVKKEDFTGVDRAVLIAEIKKKYFVSGDKDSFTLKYGIY